MKNPLDYIIDAVDVETFFAVDSEEEGRRLALQMMKDFGFKDVDVVFSECIGCGMRIRLRGNIHRPGDRYTWLSEVEKDPAKA